MYHRNFAFSCRAFFGLNGEGVWKEDRVKGRQENELVCVKQMKLNSLYSYSYAIEFYLTRSDISRLNV